MVSLYHTGIGCTTIYAQQDACTVRLQPEKTNKSIGGQKKQEEDRSVIKLGE